MGIAVDIDGVGKTMVTWSPSAIRSFGPSGPPPTAYRLRSAASSLSGLLHGCSCTVASPNADLDDAVRSALNGLIQQSAA